MGKTDQSAMLAASTSTLSQSEMIRAIKVTGSAGRTYAARMPVGDGQTGDDFWNGLEGRVLHPVRVEIIEALRWIGQPVLTTDLLGVLDWKRVGLRVEHHLRQLTKLGIVERGEGNGMIQSHQLAGRLRR